MEFISDIYGTVVPFLIILTVLVYVHEMGHYLVARRNGVRVEVFSIGFGPEIYGWTNKANTRWKISLIPLGGYVKMFGDADAASRPSDDVSEMSEEERAVAFPYKRLSQRVWIVAAGPAANFAFAIVLMAGLFSTIGQPFSKAIVGEVIPDSAAEIAGFMPGDRITSVDGWNIERFEELKQFVALRPDQRLEIIVERDGAEVTLTAVPNRVVDEDVFGNKQETGQLGIRSTGVEYVRHNPPMAVWYALRQTVSLTANTLEAVGQMIVGTRDANELGGPIRIAQMSGQVAEIGIPTMIWFTAVLSINLGLINLFPIPMLDGGHLLFYGIEALRGRPLGERAQEYGFRIGLALVLSLFVFVTWNDLARFEGLVDFVKALVT